MSLKIIVPIYKKFLSKKESFSLDYSLRNLNTYDCVFVAPSGLDVSFYASRYRGYYYYFSASFFSSIQSYNQLMLNINFYEAFRDVDFLLILQPDVFVFRDDLNRWLNSPFDYIGAPWPAGFELNVQIGKFSDSKGASIKVFVGNGGFSLRRREKCIKLIYEHPEAANWFTQTGSNEDLFFSIMGALSSDFILPNQIIASQFAVELEPAHYFKINNNTLPMAVHAWDKYDPEFWREHMPPWPESEGG